MSSLLKLTWLEIKIFAREPLGVFGTVGVPVLIFVLLGRFVGEGMARVAARPGGAVDSVLPVTVSLLIALGAVSSLVTIISIYREGGILKRLRATPLSPVTILSAHVLVKLILTAVTLLLMVAAGRRYLPSDANAPLLSYVVALLITTWSILSVGFVIASLVPVARFAQPAAALVFYPMVALSGLFFSLDVLPRPAEFVSRLLPLRYAVSLLDGIWKGEGWWAHAGDVGALVAVFLVFTAISSRVFRWE
jgi:ABC-2 type transport system permease protein